MLHFAVFQIAAALGGASASIAKVRSPLAGTITRADVVTEAPNSAGAATFDVLVNGASIFTSSAHRPSVAAGASVGYSTSIDTPAVARRDLLSIDLATMPAGSFAANSLTVVLTIDDGIASALAGDAAGPFGANVVGALVGRALDTNAPAHEQIFSWSMFAGNYSLRARALTHDDLIDDLYYGALGRVPNTSEQSTARASLLAGVDSAGLSGLLSAIQTLGHSLFTGSEYVARGRSDAQFVSDLYAAYLGRGASSGESATWLATLAGSTRSAVDSTFSQATELSQIRLRRVTATGGSRSRADFVITTASLASGATETGAAALGRAFILQRLSLDFAARVRLYKTAATRDADLTRAAGTDPAAGSQIGDALIGDYNLDATTGLVWIDDQVGSNGDAPASSSIYYSITNNSGGARAINATVTRTILEA